MAKMKVADAIDKARNLFNQKDFKKALKIYLQLEKFLPNDPGIKSFIGIIYKELKQENKSIAYLEDAYQIKQNVATAINLSNSLKSIEEYTQAADILLKHANDDDDDDDVIHMLFNNLALIKRDQGFDEEAVNYLEMSLSRNENFTPAMVNLANILKSNEFANSINLNRAESLYKRAIFLNPTLDSSYINLFDLLYKTNRTNEIPILVESIPDEINNLDVFKIFLGCSLNEEKKFLEAEKLLSSFSLAEEKDIQLSKFEATRLYFLARSYDGLKNYNSAYHNYKLTKEVTFNDRRYKSINKENFLNIVNARLDFFNNQNNIENLKSDIDLNKTTKYFITGCPRSGTTLIDTILRSHKEIHSMEEKGSLKRTIQHFSNSMTDLSYLQNVNTQLVKKIRNFYESDISKYYDNDKNIQIDRHPFHCIYSGEIKKIFSNSKIIFVARNPLDVIFSCFTQNFKPQISTANFQNLSDSKHLYQQCMKLWFATSESLDIECHYIKYEDLIINFDQSISGVLNFLGCEWDESIKKFYETAKSRSIIKTASHSQVTKPLYKSSIEKWKNYINFFDIGEDFNELETISNKLGYKGNIF